jgi:hypothetical protein
MCHVLDVGVLEEVDGEGGQFNTTTNLKGMPNVIINPGDFMALVVFDATNKVVKKAQASGFNPMGKHVGPSSNSRFLNKL